MQMKLSKYAFTIMILLAMVIFFICLSFSEHSAGAEIPSRYRYATCENVTEIPANYSDYFPEPEPVQLYEELSVPYNNNALAFMYNSAITSRTSPQWALRWDENTYTNDECFRMNGEYYLVAMGYYYGAVGDRLKITMDNGLEYKVMLGDNKAIADTDSTRRVCNINGSIVEFIVDKGFSSTALNQFYGSIVKIEREI